MSGSGNTGSESRGRVLNAAYELFLQFGFTAVSMQQIADAASITKATLYHHFRDKQDLYTEVVRLAISRNLDAIYKAMSSASDMESLVRQVVRYVFGDTRSNLLRLSADFRTHVAEETRQNFWQEQDRPWTIIQVAVQRVLDVRDDQAEFLARYMFGSVAGLSRLFDIESDAYDVTDEVLENAITLLLNGVQSMTHPE